MQQEEMGRNIIEERLVYTNVQSRIHCEVLLACRYVV